MKIIGTAKTDLPYRAAEPVQIIEHFRFSGEDYFVCAYVLNDHGQFDFVVRTKKQMTGLEPEKTFDLFV